MCNHYECLGEEGMRYMLSILLAVMLGGCTVMQPRLIPMDFASECKSIECVVDAVDTLRDKGEYGGTRYLFMEGYQDTYLRGMLEDNRLDIEEINPLWVPLGVLGYATMYPGKYGEMWRCTVRYMPMGNYFLVHELLHCQGYKDRGYMNPLWFMDTYSEEQMRIMESEGVSSWIQTEFYRNKKYITEEAR
jgi:hypothetical protein